MYLTTTGNITTILTRKGRQLLADNSANFKITSFRFSDDEIDYSNFDGSSVDAPNDRILATPILEACTFGDVPSQKFEVFSNSPGVIQIARLDVDINNPFVDGQQLQRLPRTSARMFLNVKAYTIGGFRKIDTPSSNILAANLIPFTVRTFNGYDSAYFLRSLTPDIVETPQQQFNDVVPCSDPYTARLNQSQARLAFSLKVSSDTQVVPGFNTTMLWNFLVDFRQDPEVLKISSLGGFNRLIDSYNKILAMNVGNRASIDQFGEVGFAYGRIEITGANTGQKFQVDMLIYDDDIINSLLSKFPSEELGPAHPFGPA